MTDEVKVCARRSATPGSASSSRIASPRVTTSVFINESIAREILI